MKTSWVAWFALFLSVFSSAVAIYAALCAKPAEEERVYRRILAEVATEIQPIYGDFGIALPGPPRSFRELLAPLLAVRGEIQSPP